MYIAEYIEVRTTVDKGNGVFTKISINKDTVIEVSPVIVMTGEERKLLDKTLLHDYIFEWKVDNKDMCCMAQGYISVYNHSEEANCEYFMDYDKETIAIKTVRNITANEELTVNYNGDWNDSKPVWFDTIED